MWRSAVSVALSAQNVYWEESGAFTGETSPAMLTSVGATHCIIGHSERRGYFGETDEDINRKAKALMAHDIVPISCCGESLEVRNAGTHVQFVVGQIKADTKGLEITDPSKYDETLVMHHAAQQGRPRLGESQHHGGGRSRQHQCAGGSRD